MNKEELIDNLTNLVCKFKEKLELYPQQKKDKVLKRVFSDIERSISYNIQDKNYMSEKELMLLDGINYQIFKYKQYIEDFLYSKRKYYNSLKSLLSDIENSVKHLNDSIKRTLTNQEVRILDTLKYEVSEYKQYLENYDYQRNDGYNLNHHFRPIKSLTEGLANLSKGNYDKRAIELFEDQDARTLYKLQCLPWVNGVMTEEQKLTYKKLKESPTGKLVWKVRCDLFYKYQLEQLRKWNEMKKEQQA